MPKLDAKSDVPINALVIGGHPAAFLAAALLRHDAKPAKGDRVTKPKPKLRVVQVPLPDGGSDDRLVTINPELFKLHPLLTAAGRELATSPVYGVRFLADDPATASEYRTPEPVVRVATYRAVRDATAKLAEAAGVELAPASTAVHVERVDETGVHATLGKLAARASAVVLAGGLPAVERSTLGVPDGWPRDVVHRFTTVRCRSTKHLTLDERPLMPMSLDLCNHLCWAWLVPGDGEFQLTVEQPLEPAPTTAGRDLLNHWVGVLQRHGVLGPKFTVDPTAISSAELPLAGALAHEGVASRTLLVGHAGGFLSACGEDVYPGCWSAVFAADVLKKSLKREHLQDALGDYRQVWRTTLGDYLRGPQQNLRLLLPLVYRNPVMTARLAEAILLSKSVVR